jgi:hypothetical protein
MTTNGRFAAEHLLGHDGGEVRFAGTAYGEDSEGLRDRIERQREIVGEQQLLHASISSRI